ncbi:MAG: hypothetical protein R3C49_17010 [Planctomycetaceae bacterium]
MSAADRTDDDLDLAAKLFDAGRRQVLSSDFVVDAIQQALKSGRSLRQVFDDHSALSQQHRESIRRVVSETARTESVDGPTLRIGQVSETPGPHSGSGPAAVGTPGIASPAASTASWAAASSAGNGSDSSASDRYEHSEEIGRGGWGVVLRAHDRQLERPVAVKKLNAAASSDANMSRRFLHEAMITGQLQHRGLCPSMNEASVRQTGSRFMR